MAIRMETFPPIKGLLVHHINECGALGGYTGAQGVSQKTQPITPWFHHSCLIHNPSDHHMRAWPYNWRDDRGLMERICSHGIGHPDPDDIAHKRRVHGDRAADAEAIHGCDGCCTPDLYGR